MFGKKKSKQDKLMDLLEKISELYPKLDRVICIDLEDPESIILCSEERAMEVAGEMGLDYMLDDVAPEIEVDENDLADLLGISDDDDDEGGGILH